MQTFSVSEDGMQVGLRGKRSHLQGGTAEVASHLFSQKRIQHGGSGQLDGVAASFFIRMNVLCRGDAADPDEAELQGVLANNTGEEAHLRDRGFANGVAGDAAFLAIEERTLLSIENRG